MLLILNFINFYEPEVVKAWLQSYVNKGFTPNKGQINANEVLFYSRNGNMDIFITKSGISYVVYDIEKKQVIEDKDDHCKKKYHYKALNIHYSRIDYDLIGGSIKKENIVYQDELPGYENYYLGHQPEGILFVKSYRKVIIKDVYPGINWIFRYDDNGNFHHEFELRNPELISQIKLKVKYADIELTDNSKSIILSTPIGKIKDGSLVGYQGNSIVDVSYKLIDNSLIAFDVKNFDKDKSLFIDPYVLVWSTYYGGSQNDWGASITTDNNGNVFVVGATYSLNFPTYNPGNGAYFQGSFTANSIVILKFNNNGVRLWATFYGGSNGWNFAWSVAVDGQGNVFVTGQTHDSQFPTYNPGNGAYYQGILNNPPDAFILKFNNIGVRLWATYYGGEQDDYGNSITVTPNGKVFVTGYCCSENFPLYNPGNGAFFMNTKSSYDIFILGFDNNGVRWWATFYTGNGQDEAYSITSDIYNNIYITGYTNSTNFPTYNPGGGAYFQGNNPNWYDMTFILKFNNNGVRLWATYFGNGGSYGRSVSTDPYGNVYLTGYTGPSGIPTQNPGGGVYFQGNHGGGSYDAFISKFSNSGSLIWSTYYGGNDNDEGLSISSDAQGNIFLFGRTRSTNFPIQPNGSAYYQSNNAGGWDAFIVQFSNSGIRQWATYFGGSGDEGYTSNYSWLWNRFSIRADIYGNVFITGNTNSTTNFPLKDHGSGAYFDNTQNGNFDAFIAKFSNITPIDIPETPLHFRDNIFLNLSQVASPIIIKIYSVNGELVFSKSYENKNLIILNIRHLRNGLYILRVYSFYKEILTYKFIKS